MARDFSGTGQYLTVSDSDSLSYTSGGMSVAFVMTTDAVATACGVFSKYQSGGLEWNLGISGSKLYWLIYDNTNTAYIGRGTTLGDIVDGTEYRVMCTYNGGTASSGVKTYLNGTQKDAVDFANGVFTSMRNTAMLVEIGRSTAWSAVPFNGRLSEISIWRSCLSVNDAVAHATGISPLLISASTLDHYWPLLGRSDPEPDLVGGNSATNTSATWFAHPRIIYSRRRSVNWAVAAAGGLAIPPWLLVDTNEIVGANQS